MKILKGSSGKMNLFNEYFTELFEWIFLLHFDVELIIRFKLFIIQLESLVLLSNSVHLILVYFRCPFEV